MADPRGTRRGRTFRAHILGTMPNTCCICRQPINLTLPGTHPRGPTIHHVDPYTNTPERVYDQTNVRPAHRVCNERQGTKPLDVNSRDW